MSRRNHRSRPVEAVKRPEAAEARRLRAAELLAQGRSQAEVAEAVGVSRESVRRWQARLAQGGVAALRRRRAAGRHGRADRRDRWPLPAVHGDRQGVEHHERGRDHVLREPRLEVHAQLRRARRLPSRATRSRANHFPATASLKTGSARSH